MTSSALSGSYSDQKIRSLVLDQSQFRSRGKSDAVGGSIPWAVGSCGSSIPSVRVQVLYRIFERSAHGLRTDDQECNGHHRAYAKHEDSKPQINSVAQLDQRFTGCKKPYHLRKTCSQDGAQVRIRGIAARHPYYLRRNAFAKNHFLEIDILRYQYGTEIARFGINFTIFSVYKTV